MHSLVESGPCHERGIGRTHSKAWWQRHAKGAELGNQDSEVAEFKPSPTGCAMGAFAELGPAKRAGCEKGASPWPPERPTVPPLRPAFPTRRPAPAPTLTT